MGVESLTARTVVSLRGSTPEDPAHVGMSAINLRRGKTMGRFIVLYNQDQMRTIGCGYRSVYVDEGRKWVKVLDWSTSEQSRVSRRELSEMEVSDRQPPKLKYLHEGFQRNQQRAKKMYQSAIASVREARLQKRENEL